MNKKEQKSYKRQISNIAEGLLIQAHKEAFEIVDGVFMDILFELRGRIDEIIERKRHEQ